MPSSRTKTFDLEGRPRRTRQTRYAEESGFGAKTVLDSFTQEHPWNVHGERTSWTMPLPAGFATAGWTASVDETHDDEGNVATLSRTLVGASSATPLMSATYRASGRAINRTITTGSSSIERAYHYDETTGQLDDLTVRANGTVVAGSHIEYQGEQVRKETLHGISGESRANEYSYDLRGRLLTSKNGREEEAAVSTEHLDAADFREQLERASAEAAKLPSLAFEEQLGHKIAKVTRGEETRSFSYGAGAERVSDGRFTYEFDARGRLIKATELAATNPRRVQYDYSPAGRIVGRHAEYESEGNWKLEDRAAILDADDLPAETTFVWDPISDQLISVYAAGGATLLRQIIHGGAAYDDPIEVATAPNARLYPIFDEAGAGTLRATLNSDG